MTNNNQKLTPKQQEQDERFRSKMLLDPKPEAQAWTELDKRARDAQGDAAHLSAKLENRIDPARHFELEQRLADARSARNEHQQSKRPSILQPGARKEWTTRQIELQDQVNDARREMKDFARNASPEVIADMQQRIAEKRTAMDEAAENRRAIAELPSEQQGRVMSMQERIEERRSAQAWTPPPAHRQQEAVKQGRYAGWQGPITREGLAEEKEFKSRWERFQQDHGRSPRGDELDRHWEAVQEKGRVQAQ